MSLGATTSDISRSVAMSLSVMVMVASMLAPGTSPVGSVPNLSLTLSPSSSTSSSTAVNLMLVSLSLDRNVMLSRTPV